MSKVAFKEAEFRHVISAGIASASSRVKCEAPDASEAGDVIGQALSRSINCELNADFVSRFLGRIIDSIASTISQGHPTYPTPVMDPHMI